MTPPPAPPLTSPRPYLIRAWHDWMVDNGLTPYIMVKVDATVNVPREYVRNGEVVLNISSDATGGLSLGNEAIRFQARFSGRVRDIHIPVERVATIFARENGQGMAFDMLSDAEGEAEFSAHTNEGAEKPAAGLALVSKDETEPLPADEADTAPDAPPDTPPEEPPPAGPKGGGLRVVK
ncbi:MAG: ClpXP protease specificity-enhancing factor [Brachymonas sp.]|nr:ClpXP protease specificity-enhancing factor [Brachymonas sp.]